MTDPLPDDVAAARVRAGTAVRALGHALVGHVADAAALELVAESLETHAAALATGAVRNRAQERTSGDWGPPPADGAEMTSYTERPISGTAAPYGLDVRVFRDGDEAVGKLTLQAAHEGAPGRCHGGIVSALFDDVYGFLLTITQQPGFTGTLTVRYERGVPIGRPVECRVRVDGIDGRKMQMSGEITGLEGDGERVVYTRSSAVFITIEPDEFSTHIAP